MQRNFKEEYSLRIDSHQHYWITALEDEYYWLNADAGVLYRDYLPAELKPQLVKAGVAYTVIVQAAESDRETDWMLKLAEGELTALGVVGWIDFELPPDDFRSRLDLLMKHPKFCGIRPMLQDMEDDRYIMRPRVLDNVRTVAAADVPFDILIYPKHLPVIYEFLHQVPALRAVVDHIAKPHIKDGIFEPWAFWMEKIAEFPNVWCKVSGMVTEANHTSWKPEDFVPYVHHVFACFGSKRTMFGSDWPVATLAAAYEQVVQLLEVVLPESISAVERQAIFGTNCAAFYKLNIPG